MLLSPDFTVKNPCTGKLHVKHSQCRNEIVYGVIPTKSENAPTPRSEPRASQLLHFITARNATQGGFHPTRNSSTGWFKVLPAVSLSPAVPLCTRFSAGMKPPSGLRFVREHAGLATRPWVRATTHEHGRDAPIAPTCPSRCTR